MAHLLTNQRHSVFTLSLKYPLLKNYTFEELEKKNLKELQSFLNKVSNMTVDQVDKLYKRKSDKHDIFMESQINHYEVTPSFRIHGIIENGQFIVLRLDPNHKVHKT